MDCVVDNVHKSEMLVHHSDLCKGREEKKENVLPMPAFSGQVQVFWQPSLIILSLVLPAIERRLKASCETVCRMTVLMTLN